MDRIGHKLDLRHPVHAISLSKRNSTYEDFLSTEITRELGYRGHPPSETVTPVPGNWEAYRRYRPSARNRSDRRQGQATQPAAFLRLTSAEPVQGPLALGHLSHFGLGLFHPTR